MRTRGGTCSPPRVRPAYECRSRLSVAWMAPKVNAPVPGVKHPASTARNAGIAAKRNCLIGCTSALPAAIPNRATTRRHGICLGVCITWSNRRLNAPRARGRAGIRPWVRGRTHPPRVNRSLKLTPERLTLGGSSSFLWRVYPSPDRRQGILNRLNKPTGFAGSLQGIAVIDPHDQQRMHGWHVDAAALHEI